MVLRSIYSFSSPFVTTFKFSFQKRQVVPSSYYLRIAVVVIIKVWYLTSSWVKGLGRIVRVVTTVTAVMFFFLSNLIDFI